MQKVFEVAKKSFFTGEISTDAINQQINKLNRDGWTVINIIPKTNGWNMVKSMLILAELKR